MGQKVNPHGLRVGVIKDWDSRWFAKDDAFGDILVEDYKLRKFLKRLCMLPASPHRDRARRQENQNPHPLRQTRHGYRQGRHRDREAPQKLRGTHWKTMFSSTSLR